MKEYWSGEKGLLKPGMLLRVKNMLITQDYIMPNPGALVEFLTARDQPGVGEMWIVTWISLDGKLRVAPIDPKHLESPYASIDSRIIDLARVYKARTGVELDVEILNQCIDFLPEKVHNAQQEDSGLEVILLNDGMFSGLASVDFPITLRLLPGEYVLDDTTIAISSKILELIPGARCVGDTSSLLFTLNEEAIIVKKEK